MSLFVPRTLMRCLYVPEALVSFNTPHRCYLSVMCEPLGASLESKKPMSLSLEISLALYEESDWENGAVEKEREMPKPGELGGGCERHRNNSLLGILRFSP